MSAGPGSDKPPVFDADFAAAFRDLVLWRRDTGAVQAGTDPRWKGVGKGASSDADKGSIYR